MRPDKLALDAGWRDRPMACDEVASRLSSMLAALAAVDDRLQDWLVGGNGPDPSDGWELADTSESALTERLRVTEPSDPRAAKWTPRWHIGLWNGRTEAGGTAAGIGAVVEGSPSYSPWRLRSSIEVDAETVGLDPDQREAIVAAVLDAWDPDECTRRERFDGITRVTRYTRGEGWRPG